MTSVSLSAASFATLQANRSFAQAKEQMADLQTQLSTGQKAATYSDLGGTGAATSLALRSKLGTLDGYASNVTDATLRINLMTSGLQQIAKLSDALATSVTGTSSTTTLGQTIASVSAPDGVQQIVDALNTNVGGRYLFSGRASDVEPVASYDTIMNGDSSHAGLKTLITDRIAADLGTSQQGRLTVANSGTNVTLSEEAAGLPFGMKIASAASTGGHLSATRSAGPPASVAIAVASQPAAGDTISVGLTLPDGTQQTITLTAGSAAANAGDGTATFAIGATASDTAANIASALTGAVKSVAATSLAAASAVTATSNFFASTASSPPLRVQGSDPATATTLAAGTSANTVIWYAGDSPASPRDSAPVRIGDDQTIGIGAAANEGAFQTVLASYAVLAATPQPTEGDAVSQARYAALTSRVSTNLSASGSGQSLQDITGDFAAASARVTSASTRLAVTKTQAEDALGTVENADPTQAATELLAVQTRLSASYQITSTIAKLSLTDYL